MELPVTSKPWDICNEDSKSRNNQKSLFRNVTAAIAKTSINSICVNIEVAIVDAMRIVKFIPISELIPATFK